jgi:hypothetical protein
MLIKVGILAIFTLLLGACQKEIAEPIGSNSDMIEFSVDEVVTRGEVITDDAGINPLLSMAVFCYTTQDKTFQEAMLTPAKPIPNHMYKAHVARSSLSDKWITQASSDDAIVNTGWAGSEYHSFFALAPYGIEDASSNTFFSSKEFAGPPTFNYTLPSNPLDQKDILYSHVANTRYYYMGNRPVAFKFNHALSKISFKAAKGTYPDAENQKVVVKSFIFKNIYTTSKLSLTDDLSLPQWKPITTSKLSEISTRIGEGLENIELTHVAQNITSPAGGAMMVIPQPHTPEIKMTAIVDITSGAGIGSGVGAQVTETRTVDIVLPTPSSWVIAESYVYSFTYNGGGEVSSNVKVNITPWDVDAVDGDIHGTYLNVSNRNFQIRKNKKVKIHYKTDYEGVVAYTLPSKGTITHNEAEKYIEYTSVGVGTENIALTAGNLSANLEIQTQSDYPVDPYHYNLDKDNVSNRANSYILPLKAEVAHKFSIKRIDDYWGNTTPTDIYAGNNSERLIAKNNFMKAEILWTDFDAYEEYFSVYADANDQSLLLEVIKLPAGERCNMIVGIRGNDGKILWSWHMWLTDFPVDITATPPDMYSYTSPTGVVMMDRNLGALSKSGINKETHGLFYQWGRKDPFPVGGGSAYDNSNSATLIDGVLNPIVFYAAHNGAGAHGDWVYNGLDAAVSVSKRWDDTASGEAKGKKTIYDPSPRGWRVGPGKSWSGFIKEKFILTLDNEGRIHDGNLNAFFPRTDLLSNTNGAPFGGARAYDGCYWGASSYGAFAQFLQFKQNGVVNLERSDFFRADGFVVRPVLE